MNPSAPPSKTASRSRRTTRLRCAAGIGLLWAAAVQAADPVTPLPSLDVPSYMGTWYQVAWFPNRFQRQCVSDTTATYKRLPDGNIEVSNRCKLVDGRTEEALGLARPKDSSVAGDSLQPARLEVSFLPAALRWLPIWGGYWVLQRAADGRYAVVGEPKREYLWVLSRTPSLAAADETEIRSRLLQQGYDLTRWQAHTHAQPASPNSAPR